MYIEFSRTHTIHGMMNYLVGGTKEKYQEFVYVSSNDIFMNELLLESYYSTKSKEQRKQFARQIGKNWETEFQHRANLASSRVKNAAPYSGYISFTKKDIARLQQLGIEKYPDNKNNYSRISSVLGDIYNDYMKQLGLADAQTVAVLHLGTNLIHLHFAFSAIYDNGKAIDNHFIGRRSDKACAYIEQKYNLEKVHKKATIIAEAKKEGKSVASIATTLASVPQYHDENYAPNEDLQNERTRAINEAKEYIRQLLLTVTSVDEFIRKLKEKNIKVEKSNKHKRAGLVYTINGEQFAAFTLDRSFTLAAVCKAIAKNAYQCQQKKQNQPTSTPKNSIPSVEKKATKITPPPTNKSHGTSSSAADNHEDLTDEETKSKRYQIKL